MARSTASKVRGAEEHRDAHKAFLGHLRAISSNEGWSEYTAFEKFLDAGTRALRNPILKLLREDAKWDANEAAYMQIVKSCRKPSETMTLFAAALAEMQVALSASPKDFLSPIFMEVANNPAMGQFFTPWELSYMMAKMTLQDARGLMGGNTYISIQEPACGVGGMVMAGSLVCQEQGLDLGTEVHWTCIDVDWKAVCGTFLQASMIGVSAEVIHGNALSLEVHDVLPTINAVLYPKHRVVARPGPPVARTRTRSRPAEQPRVIPLQIRRTA